MITGHTEYKGYQIALSFTGTKFVAWVKRPDQHQNDCMVFDDTADAVKWIDQYGTLEPHGSKDCGEV